VEKAAEAPARHHFVPSTRLISAVFTDEIYYPCPRPRDEGIGRVLMDIVSAAATSRHHSARRCGSSLCRDATFALTLGASAGNRQSPRRRARSGHTRWQ